MSPRTGLPSAALTIRADTWEARRASGWLETAALAQNMPPEQFVRLTILASAAVMPMYEQMDEAAREALVAAVIREVAETVEVHRDGDELAFTMASHIAVAQG